MVLMFAPGGRCAISPMTRLPSGRWNHSMCVTPSVRPSALIAPRDISRAPSYSGPEMSRGSTQVHWIHGFSSTSRHDGK